MRASPPLLAALLLAPLAASHAGEPLRYNRDIRPILSENCFACHGPDKANQKAGLRLDVRDAAIQPAKSGDIAIVPGDAEKSTLVARIFTEDSDEIMPPPKSHKNLSAAVTAERLRTGTPVDAYLTRCCPGVLPVYFRKT